MLKILAIQQDSFQYHCLDIQGAFFFKSRVILYWMNQQKFTRLAGCEIKRIRPIFRTKMVLYQPKANLDGEILCGNITHL